jgi:hypothetical protein
MIGKRTLCRIPDARALGGEHSRGKMIESSSSRLGAHWGGDSVR